MKDNKSKISFCKKQAWVTVEVATVFYASLSSLVLVYVDANVGEVENWVKTCNALACVCLMSIVWFITYRNEMEKVLGVEITGTQFMSVADSRGFVSVGSHSTEDSDDKGSPDKPCEAFAVDGYIKIGNTMIRIPLAISPRILRNILAMCEGVKAGSVGRKLPSYRQIEASGIVGKDSCGAYFRFMETSNLIERQGGGGNGGFYTTRKGDLVVESIEKSLS